MKIKPLLLATLAAVAAFAECAQACPVTPIEVIRRALFKSAVMVPTLSDTAQFAGRTLIAIGAATVVISTYVVGSDSLIFHSPLGNANVASGSGRFFEVKTISPGGYFTLGTQDGAAVPRDTTLMWEMRRAS